MASAGHGASCSWRGVSTWPLECVGSQALDTAERGRSCPTPADPAQLDSFRSHYELQRPPRGPEARAAVIHMAVSMFEAREPCWGLIDRTRGRIGDHVAELHLGPHRGICVAKTGGPFHLVGLGTSRSSAGVRLQLREPVDVADILREQMTYSIFDSTGNLVDAFDEREPAIAALAAIVQAEPESADDVFLVAQDADGSFVGDTLYGSSLHAAA